MAKADKENNFIKTVKSIIAGTEKKEKTALAADTVLKEAVKIFSKLNQPYAVITKANKLVYANNAFIELLGTAVLPENIEDIIAKNEYKIFERKSDDTFCFEDSAVFASALSFNGKNFNAKIDISYLGAGKKEKYASLNISEVDDKAYNLRNVETEILRSRNYLESLFSALPFASFVRDDKGVLITANNYAKALLGANCGFEETPNQMPKQVFKDDCALDKDVFKTDRALEGAEISFKDKSGKVKFYSVSKIPLCAESGERKLVLSVIEDITSKKQHEEKTVLAKNLLSMILDYAPLAFYTRDEKGNISFWNKKTAEIFADNFTVEGERGVLHESKEHTKSCLAMEKEIVKEGKVVFCPAQEYNSKSGGKVFLDLIKVPIPESSSSPACVLTIAQDITEKYIQEREGSKTNNILQAIFNEAPVAIYARDASGDIIFRNKKTMEIYGAGGEPSEDATEEQKDFYKKRDLSVLKNGKVLYLPEEEYVGIDGGKRVIRAVKSPISDNGGKPFLVVTIGEDITAAYEREREVLHYKNFLQDIINNLPVALYAKKYTGEYILWNKKCGEVFGKKAEEVIGKTTHNDKINPEQEEFIRMQDQKVFDAKRELDIPQELISTQDGEIKIMHTVKTPLFFADGTPNCLLGVSEDITAKSKMERQVYESRSKYSLLVESCKEGILIIEQGKISFANKTLLNSLGYEEDDVKGKSFCDLASAGSEDVAREFYDKVFAGTAASDYAFIKMDNKNKDEVFEFEVSAAISKYLGKKIVIMFLRNITKERSMENKAKAKDDRFRSVFEGTSIPLIILQHNGYIYDMNRAARDILGFTKEDKPLYGSIFIKPGLPLKARRAMAAMEPCVFDGKINFDRLKKTLSGLNKNGVMPLKVSMTPVNERTLSGGKTVCDYILQLTADKSTKEMVPEEGSVLAEDMLSYQEAVLLCSREGLILKCNKRAEQLFGISFVNLYSKPLASLFTPRDKAAIELDMAELYNHGSVKSRDYKIKKGESAGVEVEANAVLAKNNNFIISFRNISAKKQLLDVLDERSQYAQALMQIVDGALLECDIEDKKLSAFTKVNDAACSFTGYSMDELMKLSLFDLLVDKEKKESKKVDAYLASKAELLRKDKLVSFEAMLNIKDRQKAAVVRISSFRSGDSEKAVIVIRDASKERQLASELDYKLKELKGVKNILPGLYIKLDSKGIIQEYQTAEAGYDIAVFPSDYLGHPMQEFLSREEGDLLLENIKQAYKTGVPVQTSFSMQSGGEPKFYEASISRLEGEDSVVMLVENVDRRKGLENKIHHLYDFSSRKQRSFVENMKDVLEYGKQIFGAEVGLIMHFSGRNRDKILINYATDNPYDIKKGIETAVEECLRDVQDGKVYACRDTSILKCVRCLHVKRGINSIIAAPLYIAGKVEGAIAFVSVKKNTMPLTDEDKSFISFVGGLMSMALEIRQNQKAVDNSLGALRRLASSLDVPAAIIDENFKIKNLNSVMRNICGIYDIVEAEDQNIFVKFAYDSLKAEGDFKSAYKTSKGGAFDFLFDINIADGSKVNLVWHVVEIKDGKGAVKGFLLASESVNNVPSLKPFLQGYLFHS